MKNYKSLGIIILITALTTFLGTTVIASFAQQQDSTPQEKPEQKDEEIKSTAELVRSLQAKESELQRRQKELLQREQQIIVQEKDLADRINAFDQQVADFEQMKKQWQDDQNVISQAAESERIQNIAASFKNVKSGNAAAQLIALFEQNRTTALLILNQLDTRTFGKIFNKIENPAKAAQLYEALKDWNISVEQAREIVDTDQEQ